jgi:hypothetical protein
LASGASRIAPATDSTDGLVRGMPATDTGGPITVPVGEAAPDPPPLADIRGRGGGGGVGAEELDSGRGVRTGFRGIGSLS